MSRISIHNIAQALYESSVGKTERELDVSNTRAIEMISSLHMLDKSEEILKTLESIIDKHEQRKRVQVTSIKKLTSNEEKTITEYIKQKYDAKEVTIHEKIDPKVLGGVRIEIEDEVIDMTLSSKLQKLQIHLNK